MGNRFKEAAGELIPDILCASAQSLEAPIDYLNDVRDGLLGTNGDPNDDAAGFRNPIQKFLCNLGPNPSTPNLDPTQGLPGSCDARYNLFAFITWLPKNGGAEQTQRFGTSNQTYTGPLGLDSTNISVGGKFSIEFSQTNGIIEGPFFRGAEPTYVLDLQRVDGQPDNCGADGQPIGGGAGNGGRPTGGGDITYDDEDGVEVTEPYTFKAGPIFKLPGGDTFAPFEICIAAFCLNVDFNLNTGQPEPGKKEPENDRCCPEVGEPDVDPGGDDPAEPANDTRYVGAITRCVIGPSASGFTEKGDGEGPLLFVPSLGVIRFAVEIGGRRAWTMDQPIKTLTQVTEVNFGGAAYSWSVYPKKGVDIFVTGVPVAE